MVLLAAALLGVASAHVPHDPIKALIPPVGLDPEAPWYAIGDHGDRSLLHRGSGLGPSGWTVVGGEPTGDLLLDGCQTADGVLVLVSARRLWWSEDEGASWEEQEPGPPLTSVACDPELVLASEEGVLVGALGGPWEPSHGDLVVDSLHPGPGGLVAVAAEAGSLLLRLEQGWATVPGPGPRLRSAVLDERGVLYAGDDQGGIWRQDGVDWQACAPLPADEGQGLSYPHTLAITADGDRLLAAAAWRGPFVSEDGCGSWEDRHAEMDPYFEGSGHCASVSMAFTDLFASGDRWALSGWDGLALSEDAGASWVEPFLIAPAYARGLAVSPGYARDAGVWLGSYAAGVTRSGDGGQSFLSRSAGLAAPNVQRLAFPPTNSGERPLFAISGHLLWRSDDGASWTLLEPPQATVSSIAFLEGPPRLWSIGTGVGEEPKVAESLDHGRGWHGLDALEEALGDAALIGAAQLHDRLFVTTQGPAAVLHSDDGEAWSEVRSDEAELVGRPLAWPAADPERVLVPVDGAVLWSDDGERWSAVELSREPVLLLEQADDGTLFAATRGGLVLRSDDGGEAWTELELRLPASPYALAPLPGFAELGHLLVGTHDGPYVLLDAWSDAPSWGPWGGDCLVDDLSNYVEREGLEPEEHEGQRLVSVHRVAPGATMRTGLRGHHLRIHGAVERASEVRVLLDGEEAGSVGATSSEDIGVLWERSGLDDGWHEIALEGVSGEGVLIDAFQGQREALSFAAPEVVEDDAPGSRCEGCATGGGAAGLPLLPALMGLLAIRRRGAPAPPPGSPTPPPCGCRRCGRRAWRAR